MAPIISIFNGITVSINYRDHNPPHCHAKYGEFVATYNLKTGEIMEGSFPKKQNKRVRKWARQNQKELLENWKLARSGQQTFRIPGELI